MPLQVSYSATHSPELHWNWYCPHTSLCAPPPLAHDSSDFEIFRGQLGELSDEISPGALSSPQPLQPILVAR